MLNNCAISWLVVISLYIALMQLEPSVIITSSKTDDEMSRILQNYGTCMYGIKYAHCLICLPVFKEMVVNTVLVL